jgi:hypothetical protein
MPNAHQALTVIQTATVTWADVNLQRSLGLFVIIEMNVAELLLAGLVILT